MADGPPEDFDFADEPMEELEIDNVDDEINEVEDHENQQLMNIRDGALELFNQRLEFNVVLILNSHGVGQRVINRFAAMNITFDQLPSLTDEDLEMLGIEDPMLRARMVQDFTMYGRVEGNPNWNRRELSIVDYIHRQVERLDTLLAATMLNIGADPLMVHAPGVVLNNSHQQFFSPPAVIHLMGLMSDHLNSIQGILANLRDEDTMLRVTRDIERRDLRQNVVRGIIGALLVGLGIFLNKRFGGK